MKNYTVETFHCGKFPRQTFRKVSRSFPESGNFPEIFNTSQDNICLIKFVKGKTTELDKHV